MQAAAQDWEEMMCRKDLMKEGSVSMASFRKCSMDKTHRRVSFVEPATKCGFDTGYTPRGDVFHKDVDADAEAGLSYRHRHESPAEGMEAIREVAARSTRSSMRRIRQ